MASTVVMQPQPGGKGGQVMAYPTESFPPTSAGLDVGMGLPASLNYLAGLKQVKILQEMDMVEVFLNWEKNNKYKICNSQDQQFLTAKEDTDCLTRQCLGTIRPFVMNITDNQGNLVIQLHRPCRCQGSLLWCCCLQEMAIQSPPGMLLGTVKEEWTCWIPKYTILDNMGTPLFQIIGECCYCKCCTDVLFHIFDINTGQEVGQLMKHWTGCREIFGGANDFSINYAVEMDLRKKALLLGATYLVDFMYFEINRN